MNRCVQGILHDNITTSDRNPKCIVVKNYPLSLNFSSVHGKILLMIIEVHCLSFENH